MHYWNIFLGHLGFLQLLIAKGAKVNAGLDSTTPLMRAAARGMRAGVKFLLENDADVSAMCYVMFYFYYGLVLLIVYGHHNQACEL